LTIRIPTGAEAEVDGRRLRLTNLDKASTVAASSLRAKLERPTVSAPFGWEEIAAAVDAGSGEPLLLGSAEVLERVGERDDLFAPVLTLGQRLPG
jgi:bifunctional non-homologous end joining protein LigD